MENPINPWMIYWGVPAFKETPIWWIPLFCVSNLPSVETGPTWSWYPEAYPLHPGPRNALLGTPLTDAPIFPYDEPYELPETKTAKFAPDK